MKHFNYFFKRVARGHMPGQKQNCSHPPSLTAPSLPIPHCSLRAGSHRALVEHKLINFDKGDRHFQLAKYSFNGLPSSLKNPHHPKSQVCPWAQLLRRRIQGNLALPSLSDCNPIAGPSNTPPLLNSSGLLSRQNPPNLLQLNFLSLPSRKSFYCSGL